MRRSILAIVAALASCGGGFGPETPEQAARAFVDVYFAGDHAGLRALWVKPASMELLFACDATAPRTLASDTARALAELDGIHRWKDVRATVVDWTHEARTIVRVGEVRDGCTARRDVELATGEVGVRITASDPRAERWRYERPPSGQVEHTALTLIRIDEGWRLLDRRP